MIAQRRVRFGLWIGCVVVLFFLQLIWVWLLRGSRISEDDGMLIGGQMILGGVVIAIIVLLQTTRADAIRVPRRVSGIIIVSGTVVLQAMAVIFLVPALSEDLFRYRLDGRMWLGGVSPYAMSPAEWMDSGRADAIDRRVTFPEMRTI